MERSDQTKLHTHLANLVYALRTLLRWLLAAGLIGAVCGAIGAAFHYGVDFASALRAEHPWLLWCLPLLGPAVVGVYRFFRTEGLSTDSVLDEVLSGSGLRLTLLPAVFLATLLSHLGGASVGREGAALQMGGAVGYGAGRLLRLDESDRRTATMAGMAALFSALFATPVAAAVFAMSVVSVGVSQFATLLPCLIASLAAWGVSLLLRVPPTRFVLAAPGPELWMFLKVGVLALLCALLSTALCLTVHAAEKQARRLLKNPWLRAFLGGAVIVGLSLLLGPDYNGAGMPVIAAAVEEGRAVPWAFAAKLLLTALSLAVGFKGGEVVPSFFIGATFGCVVGPILGIPAGFAAAVGVISSFCGAVNCPLASALLAVELFGGAALPYFALACAMSYMFSGYTGLYSSQIFLYGKLKPWPLNIRANTGRMLKDNRDGEDGRP